MTSFKQLPLYQKIILCSMILMPCVFYVFYATTISRVGFAYQGTIFIPKNINDDQIYSGSIHGTEAGFRVTNDHKVFFQYGDQKYGPYTCKKDPTAISSDVADANQMVGIELYDNTSLLFRGGVQKMEQSFLLYDQNGFPYPSELALASPHFEMETLPNSFQPSPSTILHLMDGPALTHKGDWLSWFQGTAICILNIVLILFADKIFRCHLLFQIQDVDSAEPSEFEIIGRYVGWTALAIAACIILVTGLK